MKDNQKLSCVDCVKRACNTGSRETYPDFCPTKKADPADIENARASYCDGGIDSDLTKSSMDIDSEFYCKYTRVEETIAFAHRIGAKRIGIAFCVALADEARIFADVARKNGLDVVGVVCKIGSIDKTEIGYEDGKKHKPGSHEPICNPIMQAEYLEKAGSELNILMGLCVGHDSIFYRHSNVPVTTLSVKDRVLGHNPLAAIYTAKTFYRDKLSRISVFEKEKAE